MLNRRELIASAIGAAGAACLPAAETVVPGGNRDGMGTIHERYILIDGSLGLGRWLRRNGLCRWFEVQEFSPDRRNAMGWLSGHRAQAYLKDGSWRLCIVSLLKDSDYPKRRAHASFPPIRVGRDS